MLRLNLKIAIFTIFATNAIFITHVFAEVCPDQEDIGLCHCIESSRNIQCVGNSITSINLSKLDKNTYGILYINNTTITQIKSNFLGKSSWDKIIIANNSLLALIDQNTFGNGPKLTLWVENCPKLGRDSLFNALKSILNTESIIIDGVNLNSLSANLFNANSKVKNITLNNDNISDITANVFSGLKNLILVNLDNNRLFNLPNGALNFTPDSTSRVITVSIRYNKLTDSSFTSDLFKPIDRISIDLHLEDNDLSALREMIFRPFLENGKNKLFLDNNGFHCDCNMLWLLNETFAKNVFNVACIEQKKNLFNINKEEICPTTTTTIPSTTNAIASTTLTTISAETVTPFTIVLSTLTTIETTKTQTTSTSTLTTTSQKIQTTTEILIYVKCPEIIYPCDCDETSQLFSCDGPLINDIIISRIGPKIITNSSQRYDLISISNTRITRLSSFWLTNANFNNIYIDDNNDLVDIETEMFIKSNINLLKVRRNQNLKETDIFDLAKCWNAIEVDFSHNSIERLPELAFVFEVKQVNWRITSITLDNNKISVISSYAFKGLYNLTYLSLKSNIITVIEDFGLKFDTTDKFVTILLTNNSIISQYITNRSISLSSDITLRLDLQKNKLTTIKRNIFEHILANNGSELNVFGNQFVCTCDMMWILNETIRNHIYNVYCANHYSYIFELNVTTFCNT